MSLVASTGLPVTSALSEPAAVRNGSSSVKQAYATAQGFEEMLLQQLSQSLLQSSGLGGEGGESEGEGLSGGEGSGESGAGGEAGGDMLGSLLPQTLTEGIMRDGGLGLARQLTAALDPAAAGTLDSASAITAGTGASAGATGATTESEAATGSTDGATKTGAEAAGGGTAVASGGVHETVGGGAGDVVLESGGVRAPAPARTDETGGSGT